MDSTIERVDFSIKIAGPRDDREWTVTLERPRRVQQDVGKVICDWDEAGDAEYVAVPTIEGLLNEKTRTRHYADAVGHLISLALCELDLLHDG